MRMEKITFDKRNYRRHDEKNKRVIRKSLEELGDWGLEFESGDEENDIPKDVHENLEIEYKIEVTCANESDQENMYNKLTEEGYECRILTL